MALYDHSGELAYSFAHAVTGDIERAEQLVVESFCLVAMTASVVAPSPTRQVDLLAGVWLGATRHGWASDPAHAACLLAARYGFNRADVGAIMRVDSHRAAGLITEGLRDPQLPVEALTVDGEGERPAPV